MSNAVGATAIVLLGVGGMSYMAYTTVNGNGGNGGGSEPEEPPIQEVKVRLPTFKETVKFTVVKTVDELKEALGKHRIVYDPMQISYASITKPGQCEVFMLLDNMSKVVSDYEIMRCQNMLAEAVK